MADDIKLEKPGANLKSTFINTKMMYKVKAKPISNDLTPKFERRSSLVEKHENQPIITL